MSLHLLWAGMPGMLAGGCDQEGAWSRMISRIHTRQNGTAGSTMTLWAVVSTCTQRPFDQWLLGCGLHPSSQCMPDCAWGGLPACAPCQGGSSTTSCCGGQKVHVSGHTWFSLPKAAWHVVEDAGQNPFAA